MQTDRELLELAAKAAGLDLRWADIGNSEYCWVTDSNGEAAWNPLGCDGDALRLAVKLRLNLNFEEWDGTEYACAVPHKSHQGQDEVMGDDEDAATRRAVVRAAAAMAAQGVLASA